MPQTPKTTTLTRREVLSLHSTIRTLASLGGREDFKFAIAMNRRLIEPVINTLREINTPAEAYTEYETARRACAMKWCDRDPSTGRPVEDGHGNLVFKPESKLGFTVENDQLMAQYSDAITAEEERQARMERFLDEHIDLGLVRIPSTSVPSTTTTGQYDGLFPLIDFPSPATSKSDGSKRKRRRR